MASIDSYVRGALKTLRERARARAAGHEQRGQALKQQAERAATLLVDSFGAERVILFGSVSAGNVDAHSDLDLAVEGVSPERYFEALGKLGEVADCNVDLVLLEEAPASLRRRIAESGSVLHDSP